MSDTELKPCPFCGGKPEIKDGHVYLDRAVLIKCSECLIKTPLILINHPKIAGDGLDESTRYTREQAIEKATKIWNRRTYDENNQKKNEHNG